MDGRRGPAALVVLLLLAAAYGCSAGDGPDDDDRRERGDIPMPASMAALGDSITRAVAACEGEVDCPRASWSTGTAPELDSHYQRIADARGRRPVAHNLAVSGATASGLDAQARQAVAADVEYLTILIGANDACAPTEEAMTPLDQFKAAFARALDILVEGLPRARILVVSIPDLGRLWQIGNDNPEVRAAWQALGVCPTMLAESTPTGDQADARRSRVRDRVIGYNRAMAEACRAHPTCRWDGNAVFEYEFSLEMVSPRDYWHPSMVGQRTLAEVSWKAGYWA